MQDELLIRFIDGTCTKEESEKVIEELSNDGNEATEWLQMLAAARLAGSKPVRSVLVAEAKRLRHRLLINIFLCLPWLLGVNGLLSLF